MATSFKVTPETLHASATQINQYLNEWVTIVNSIYATVEDLRVTYQGEASDQFTKQLNEYTNDFQAACDTISKYVQFLNQYADKIQSTENEIKLQATRLSVGK